VSGASVEVLRRTPGSSATWRSTRSPGDRSPFKERRFPQGETVIKEGSGGAAFYLIESGEATVSIGGEQRGTLKAGDYFGEIALIDEGVHMATITAGTGVVCYGLTLWEFRPLVEENGVIGWRLLQTLAKELRGRGSRRSRASAILRGPQKQRCERQRTVSSVRVSPERPRYCGRSRKRRLLLL
jgi:CRP/FNR family transcriptional regulator, cyclic AMP receptor protein